MKIGKFGIGCKTTRSLTAMVRVRMSDRLYPPRRGIMQTTGNRVRYLSPWARMLGEFHKNWKLVIQEIEWPRLNQALKAKRDSAVCILLGELCWVVGRQVINY